MFDTTADILDVCDLIERYEELELDLDEDTPDEDDSEEFELIKGLLNELKGCGGDEQWKGDWYPSTLIHDSYFTAYTEGLVIDCGYISKDFPYWIAIDWEKTAEAVQQDYSSVEIDGSTYWYR